MAITAATYRVDNPITRTRGIVALEKGVTSGEKVMLHELRNLDQRVVERMGERKA